MLSELLQGKTILITGGTGFLGSHLLKELALSSAQLIVLKRSSSELFRIKKILGRLLMYDLDQTALAQIFEKHCIDIIIHCAAKRTAVLADSTELTEVALSLPLKLLQLAVKHQTPIFINADTILQNTQNYYALAKKQFLNWFKLYANQMVCINVPLEILYGAHDNKDLFCSRIIHDLLLQKPAIELTEGLQKRDFTYVKDVASAFMTIILHSLSFSKNFYEFTVASGTPITVRQFVESVRLLTLNTTTVLKFGAIEYKEPMEFALNFDAIKSLGWSAEYSLLQGLTETIETERETLEEMK